MFAVPLLLLLLVASPTVCFYTSSRVDARAAVREYSEKKDPDGLLRFAIAAGIVVPAGPNGVRRVLYAAGRVRGRQWERTVAVGIPPSSPDSSKAADS
ncbi:hypothetical protein MTO96_015513 [Rhipicephalus appendiculatus]